MYSKVSVRASNLSPPAFLPFEQQKACGQLNQIDVLVVGAGVAGASTAYQLSLHGVKVVVLEAGRVGRGHHLMRESANFRSTSPMSSASPLPSRGHSPSDSSSSVSSSPLSLSPLLGPLSSSPTRLPLLPSKTFGQESKLRVHSTKTYAAEDAWQAGVSGTACCDRPACLSQPPSAVASVSAAHDEAACVAPSTAGVKQGSAIAIPGARPSTTLQPPQPTGLRVGEDWLQHEGGMAVKMSLGSLSARLKDFIDMHGQAAAVQFLRFSVEGREMQKRLAMELSEPGHPVVSVRGALSLAEKEDEADMLEEYALLKAMNVDEVQLWEEDKVSSVCGPDARFTKGLFYPNDCIVHSQAYARALLKRAIASGHVELREHSKVVRVIELSGDQEETDEEDEDEEEEEEEVFGSAEKEPAAAKTNDGVVHNPSFTDNAGVLVILADGTRLRARHLVIATGGFSDLDLPISVFLRPAWSYLITLAPLSSLHANGSFNPENTHTDDKTASAQWNSPACYEFSFAHDWAMIDGVMRLSGEDHHSALLPPRSQERCDRLVDWAHERFPWFAGGPNDAQRTSRDREKLHTFLHGVYSETPDMMPLVGKLSEKSSILYLQGCNALGQATLTRGASLVPGLLGYATLSTEEQGYAKLLSPQRASLAEFGDGLWKLQL